MKNKILLLLLISGAAIAALLLWSKFMRPESQYEIKRNYTNTLKLSKVFSQQMNKGVNKLDAFDDNIYLLDFENKIIEGIDPSGSKILDYKILSNQKDFIFESYGITGDTVNFSFPAKKSFVFGNTKIIGYSQKQLDESFSRGIKYDDGFLLKACINKKCDDEMFLNLDKNGKKKTEFDVIKHRSDGGILQDGFFIQNEGNILFVSYFLPDIFCFDKKGNYIKKFTTIDQLSAKQEVKKIGEGAYTFKNLPFVHQLTASVSNDHLFVLSSIVEKDKKQELTQVVDLYSIKTGKYVKSFTLPNNKDVFDFKVLRNEVFVLYKNRELVKYTINNLF